MELFVVSSLNVIGAGLPLPRHLLLTKGKQDIIVRQTVFVQRTFSSLPFCQCSGSLRALPFYYYLFQIGSIFVFWESSWDSSASFVVLITGRSAEELQEAQ